MARGPEVREGKKAPENRQFCRLHWFYKILDREWEDLAQYFKKFVLMFQVAFKKYQTTLNVVA